MKQQPYLPLYQAYSYLRKHGLTLRQVASVLRMARTWQFDLTAWQQAIDSACLVYCLPSCFGHFAY